MLFASVGSGSKGNATLIRTEDTCVLIDCGFSLSQFEKRIARVELKPADIHALLVTHEHGDHSGGVIRLSRKYEIPVWTTVGTASKLGIERYMIINGGQQFEIGSLSIQPVTVPHDAAEPVQFVFTDQASGRRLGILTDSGHISNHMLEAYNGLHGLLLEFNYDSQMLQSGVYPAALKRRVGGNLGHLSNMQSMDMLEKIDTSLLKCLVAAHVSENNNDSELVAALLEKKALEGKIVIACQQQGFDWIEV